MTISADSGSKFPAFSLSAPVVLLFGAICLLSVQIAALGGMPTTTVVVDPVETVQSSSIQIVTLTATVTVSGGGTPIEIGEVSFQVKDSGNNNIGTAEVDNSLTSSGVAEVMYSLPADLFGGYTIEASYTDSSVMFSPGSGTNSLSVVPNKVFVDAPGDFTITNDVSPLGGTPTAGDTVTWTSPNLGTETGAVFGINAFDTVQGAVNGVSDGGLVFIAEGTYQQGTEVSIGKSVRIFGDDKETTILDGNNAYRVINIGSGAFTVQIQNVTIQNGNSDYGAGIQNNSTGTVTLSNSCITSNAATSSTSGGGGILQQGDGELNVTGCSITGNMADDVPTSTFDSNGGGMAILGGTVTIQRSVLSGNSSFGLGGGVWILGTSSVCTIDKSTISGNTSGEGAGLEASEGQLFITNSTLSGNTATGTGGGLRVGGTATLTNATITGNGGNTAGGLRVFGGTVTLNNSIVAGNTATTSSPDISGAITSNGANFVGDATGTALDSGDQTFASTSTTITDVLDTTLEDNGGPTLTHALVSGSPAIDAADDADVPTPPAPPAPFSPPPPSDQRGRSRIIDGDGDTTATADIGAFELDPAQDPLFETKIGVAKSATVSGRDVTLDFYLENFGTETLTGLSLPDDLDAVFGVGNYTILSGPTLESDPGTITLNSSFDGSSSAELIQSGTLVRGDTAQIQLVLEVVETDQGSGLGIYSNQVTVTATGTSDLSDNGTDPDPIADGDPTGTDEGDPTPIDISEVAILGVAKNATVSGNEVTFDFYLENLGNRDLSQLSIDDNLDNVFGAGNYTVSSGPTFAVDPGAIVLNAGYDGSSSISLISSGMLNASDTAVIRIVVDVTTVTDQGSGFGAYSNQVTASGRSAAGTIVSDLSDNGIDVDFDGSGNPSDPNEDDPTTFALGQEPALGIAKNATLNGNEVTIDLYLENLGNVAIEQIYLSDDLDAAFGEGNYTVSSAPAFLDDPGTITLDASYNGGTNTVIVEQDLSTGDGRGGATSGSTLATGDTAQIQFKVIIADLLDLGSGVGVFSNQASITGQGPSGQVVQDFSDDGTDPDPNGNGNPSDSGENDATSIVIAENAEIGISKQALISESGGFNYIDWIWHIENLGNVDLVSLSLTDDLNAVFGSGNFIHSSDPSSDGTVIGNSAFNGSSNTSVISSGSLAVGESVMITAQTLVTNLTDQGFGVGIYQNQVTVTAQTSGGMPVSDVSHSGDDPDPNGDGNPAEMDPTVVDLNVAFALGVALDASVSGKNVTLDVYLENLGSVTVSEITVDTLLAMVFGDGNYSFLSDPFLVDDPGTITINSGFDGAEVLSITDGTASSLAASDTAQIRFVLEVSSVINGGLGLGDYSLQLTAGGTPQNGRRITDTSDSGTDPDPNGNGNPDEAGENDATLFTISSGIVGAAKDITIAGRQVTIDIYLEQFGSGPSTDISVIEDLDGLFGSGNYSITSAPGFVDDPGTLVLNAGYDGSAETDLLVPGTSSLSSGDTAQIQLIVNVPTLANLHGEGTGFYLNQVTVTSTDPGGLIAEDLSMEGTDPDFDADGDPSGDSTPNTIFLGNPAIGVALKTSVAGTLVTMEYVIENIGENRVSGIRLENPLNPVFGSSNYSVTSQPTLIEGPSTLNLSPQFFGFSVFDFVISGGTLEPGEVARVRTQVNITNVTDVGNGFGIYLNSVTVDATDPSGIPVSDVSDDGYLADPNGNGNAGEAGEDDATRIVLGDEANIGVAKTASVGSGTQQVTMDVYLENFGGSTLSLLSLLDNLDAVFGAGNYSINSAPTFVDDPGTITLNNLFNGSGVTDLFAAGSTLAAMDTAQIQFVIDVTSVTDQGMGSGVYESQVTAAGTAPLGSTTIDLSDSGTDPDPDGNGFANESDENDPTSFTVIEQRKAIGVAKNVSVSGNDVTIDYYLENLGSASVDTLSLVDDLDAVFGAGNYAVTTPAVLVSTPRTVTVNASFDGSSSSELIASGTLVGTEKLQIRVVVQVTRLIDGGSGLGVYSNQVTLSGEAVSDGQFLSDLSDSGTDPDPNGNSDATDSGEDDPTEFTIAQDPIIGVAQTASISNQSVTLDFFLESFGNVDVSSLSLPEDLDSLFGAGNYSISSAPSFIDDPGTINLNAGFDGSGDTAMISAGSSLAIGATAQIRMSVDVTTVTDQGSGLGIYSSQVTAGGAAPDLTSTSDLSDSGTDPDPNGNGDPTEGGENDSTSIVLESTIGDRIFNDLNGNGTDDGEPGFNGVTVFLDLNINGSLDGGEPSVMTPSSGAYSFENLAAGIYSVRVDPTAIPAGFVLTSSSNPLSVTLSAGENNTSADFGYQQQNATIGDFVWNDLNGDGVQDGGEPGLSGVTVFLDVNSNGSLDGGEPSDTTDGSGAYDFTGLATGTYSVRVDASTVTSGFVLTGGVVPTSVTLAAGEDYNDADFGYQQQDATIGDFVWNDLDGDGVQDGGEPGLSGVTVFLDLNSNGSLDGGEPSDTTDGSGAYDFTGLATGTYSVRVDASTVTSGFVLTGGVVPTSVTLAAGEDYNDADFGYQQQDATIGDFVWNDLDGDGVQDGGEPGLSGVTVFLDLNSNGALDGGEPSDTTDGSGAYDFTGLATGTYSVRVDASTVTSGFVLTGGAVPTSVALAAGEDYNDADFGYQQQDATIGDFVWNDVDGDGVQDGGEPGLSGVTVFLDLNSNGSLDGGEPGDTTDGSGAYDITGLATGTYSVRVDSSTVPAGATLTGGSIPTSVALAAGEDHNDADFGYRPTRPVFSKSFASDDIPLNGTTTLTFTVSNLGSGLTAASLAFVDNFPTGMEVAASPNIVNGCGGTLTATAGTGLVSLTGGSVASGSSCSISVDITGTSTGDLVNLTGDLTSTQGNSGTATDSLRVNPQPGFAKVFSPDEIALHTGTSTLTFTIDNLGSTAAATGLDFTDVLPAGVVVADTPNESTTCSGGTLTATAGSGTISYTGGSIAASDSCTISVDVTATSIGTKVSTSGDLTSSLGNSGSASDTLTVVNVAPTIAAPATASIATNTTEAISGISVGDTDSTTLKVTLTATQGTVSANGGSGTSLTFTDTIANVNTILAGVTFEGTLNVVGGGSSLRVTVDDLSAVAVNHDVVITLTGNSYETWRFSEFSLADVTDPAKEAAVWGELAKPANDMFPNLFKFVHGLDPQTPIFDPQVILSTTEISDQTYATYTFVKRKDLSGVTVSLEASSDVTGVFSALAGAQESVSPITGEPLFELATVTDDQPVGVDAPRFGYLQAEGGSQARTEIYSTTCTHIYGITGAESEHFSFLALTALQPKRYNGSATSVGAATLSDSLADWTGGIFTSKPHYIRITSGASAGVTADIVSHSATELTLSDDLSGLIANGDAFEIRPHTTLGRVFGEMNTAGLTEGLNASDADNLLLPDPSGAVRRFFYSNALADTGWKSQTYVNATDESLLPEGGFIVSRKQSGTMRLYIQGARRIGDLNAPIEQGFNLISIVSAKRTFSLENSGLFTGDPATGVTSGPNVNDADAIWAIDSDTGQATRYFHNGTEWLDNQFNSSNTVEFDPDDSYYIQRKPRSGVPSDSNGFNWSISDAIPGI